MHKILFSLIILLFMLVGCSHSNETPNEMAFNELQWQTMEDNRYPYRDLMLNDLIYDKKIRKLDRDELIATLGEPDYTRDDPNYLHYRIDKKNIGSWTLKTKTLVIKIDDTNNSIEWMKIHE